MEIESLLALKHRTDMGYPGYAHGRVTTVLAWRFMLTKVEDGSS
jgi:hypothetical protein